MIGCRTADPVPLDQSIYPGRWYGNTNEIVFRMLGCPGRGGQGPVPNLPWPGGRFGLCKANKAPRAIPEHR